MLTVWSQKSFSHGLNPILENHFGDNPNFPSRSRLADKNQVYHLQNYWWGHVYATMRCQRQRSWHAPAWEKIGASISGRLVRRRAKQQHTQFDYHNGRSCFWVLCRRKVARQLRSSKCKRQLLKIVVTCQNREIQFQQSMFCLGKSFWGNPILKTILRKYEKRNFRKFNFWKKSKFWIIQMFYRKCWTWKWKKCDQLAQGSLTPGSGPAPRRPGRGARAEAPGPRAEGNAGTCKLCALGCWDIR